MVLLRKYFFVVQFKARGFDMVKKLVTMFMVLAMVMICGIPVFAANGDNVAALDSGTAATSEKPAEGNITEKNLQLVGQIIRDADAAINENGIVTIKKPEAAAVTTCKKSYTITGETSEKNVKVYLAKYNEEDKVYNLFENGDGESSWDIGTYGKFAKGISLSKGANKFKVVAIKVSDTVELKAEDIQVSKFTITYFEESVADRFVRNFKDGFLDLKDALDKSVISKLFPETK
jgi:hypothetical protein